MEGDPVWLEQYRNEMEMRDDDEEEVAAAADGEPGWESNEEEDGMDVPTNERDDTQREQQEQQRHVQMSQRIDEDADIDQPPGYDDVADLPPVDEAPGRRRAGRRRARRRGRRRRRTGMVGEAVD